MSNEEKERRCKSCGKLLLDEKLPFCRRCVLEKRVPVGVLIGAIMATLGVVRLVNNNSDRNDATKV